MTTTHRIEVVLFHQLDICLRLFTTDHMTCVLVVLMKVDSLDLYRLAIYQELIADYLHLARSELKRQTFCLLALL